jgi:hypothetical protein
VGTLPLLWVHLYLEFTATHSEIAIPASGDTAELLEREVGTWKVQHLNTGKCTMQHIYRVELRISQELMLILNQDEQ